MQIKVTEKGDKIINDINQVFLDTEKQLFSGMEEDEKEIFTTLLYKALVNVSPDFVKEETPDNIHRQQA